jgi:uncharacterized protein
MFRKLTVVLMACAAQSFAQQAQPQRPFIQVTGTSESEVVPDELYITITLAERSESRDKSIQRQEEEMKKGLRELGIDLSQLTLNTADLDFRQRRLFRKDASITKSYVLKLANADMVDKVYDRLDKLEAQDAFISRYTHTRIQELQKENRIKAMQIAKEKAEYLLGAVNRQVGDPIEVHEQENYVEDHPGYHPMLARNTMAKSGDSGVDDAPLSFRKIKVRSSYLVKFEIMR